MKRTLQLVLALSFVAMFLVMPVQAATSQGLEWGVAYGDKFDFTMSSTDPEVPSEDFYINVTDMPNTAIPDPIDDWSDIPDDYDLGFYWANGTEMGLTVIIFIGIVLTGGKFIVPVGNFTLVEDLAASELTGEEITNDGTTFEISFSYEINSTHDYRIAQSFAVADGFLAAYSISTLESADDTVVESIDITRQNIPAGGFNLDDIMQYLQDPIILAAIGGVVVLLILAVVCKRR